MRNIYIYERKVWSCMATITSKDLNTWLDKENKKIEEIYSMAPHREPIEYASNDEAFNELLEKKEQFRLSKLERGSKKDTLSIADAAEIIAMTVAVTVVPTKSGYSLAVYDYDSKIYTFNSTTILNNYLVALVGQSSKSMISGMEYTLIGMKHQLAVYNPLPTYKIAVGNGIYNALTEELEPFTPRYTILTKIKTNFVKNAKPPKYRDGFTLEKMINQLANGEAGRRDLVKQICKAIITGHSLKPGLFVILGRGGDGKSTFFSMLANMLGEENVAYVNFTEFDQPDKMAETINKKLVLGLDNDPKVYLKKTSLLKTMASHEMITLSRKYMDAISVPFTATTVQLCNEFPRIAETGSSIKRRIVPFKAEYSHYENETENDNIDNVYVKDKKFLEYVLWYFLNQETSPYFSDYNDIDRQVALDVLEAEDTIGRFVESMEHLGVFSEINENIPSNHLYSAYLDWAEYNDPGRSPMQSRNFSIKIAQYMHDLGYTLGGPETTTRPKTLVSQDKYSMDAWEEYKTTKHLSAAIEANSSSRLFIRTHKPMKKRDVRRHPNVISPFEYFKADVQIIHDLGLNNENIYDDDVEEIEVVDDSNQTTESVTDITKKVTENESMPPKPDDNRVNAYDGKPYDYDVTEQRPHDLRVILRNKEVDKINEFKQWLDDLVTYSDHLNEQKVISEIDRTNDFAQQVSYKHDNTILIANLHSGHKESTIPTKVDVLKQFIDDFCEQYIDTPPDDKPKPVPKQKTPTKKRTKTAKRTSKKTRERLKNEQNKDKENNKDE